MDSLVCSFCGGDLPVNEIDNTVFSVASNSHPDCVICFDCVKVLHGFYMRHVYPLECEKVFIPREYEE